MEMKQNKLDELKGKNPFNLPEGYLEGLTEQIMAQIPDASHKEARKISLHNRIRPWLYLAATFVGLLILLRVFNNPVSQGADYRDEELFLQVLVTGEELQIISDEDMDFLEFMENQYLDHIFVEEIDDYDDEPNDID